MAGERRHAEWFGADMARGPVLSGSPEVAAVQIAAQLAQLRTPLTRGDGEIEDHAEFIRSLADKLFPDYASALRMDVGAESADSITTLVRLESGAPTLLNMWLADAKNGGVSAVPPVAVTFNSGEVMKTFTNLRHFMVLAPPTGIVSVTVSYPANNGWYWAAARDGRVFYSSALDFD